MNSRVPGVLAPPSVIETRGSEPTVPIAIPANRIPATTVIMRHTLGRFFSASSVAPPNSSMPMPPPMEKTKVETPRGIRQFDAMWVSSLCDSTAKGKPDIELVDMTSRLNTIEEIMEVTTKPIILDGDTGGLVEHFVYNVQTLERMGASIH